jgi:hypothetical protein
MGTPEGHQKSIFNTSNVKKTKIRIGSIRQSLQAQPKNIKKLTKHQINKPKKSQIKLCLVLPKCEESKTRMGATRRNLQAQPKNHFFIDKKF